MPYVDEQGDNSEEDSTGSTPLAAGAGASQQSYDTSADANQAASGGPSTIQPQGGTTNKKSPKASSGMFTNIQKYVNKNQPQAQKMSGAVTQDFSRQAGEIRQAAESKKAEQDRLMGINTGLVDTAKGQAGAAVNQIMGTQAENPQYEAASADTFQDLMGGKLAGQQQVGDLNLAKQQMRTDALSRLAKGAQTEQGRRNLLGSTFQKQGDYTRGMSGLDNLITSGDQGAREGLIQGTQGVAGDLGSQLGDITQQSRQAKTAQDLALSNLGGDVTKMASGAGEGIMSDVDAKILDEQNARNAALEGFEGTKSSLEDRIGSLKGLFQTQGENPWAAGLGNRIGSSLSGWFAPNMDLLGRYGLDTSKYKTWDDVTSQQLNQSEADLFGINMDNAWNQGNQGEQVKIGDAGNAYLKMGDELRDFNLQGDLEQQLLNQGLSYNTLQDQADLTTGNVATEQQTNRYNALKDLMGQSDIIAPQSQGDYLDQTELAELLKRYKV